MKRTRNGIVKRRRLNLELLETRRLLTVLIDPIRSDVNPSPDDTITIETGSQARIDLLANDSPGAMYAPRYEWIDTIHSTYLSSPVIHSHRVDSVNDAQAGSHELLADHRTLIYTPDDGFAGIDQFTYVGLDYRGESYEATITINVVQPIVAIPDWFRIDQGDQSITLDVALNDGANLDMPKATPGDPTLSITSVTSPSAGGAVTISENGEFLIYTPAADFTGLETLSYSVANEDGSIATTFVDLRVTAVGNDDTSEWTEWWKHQAISASLDANHGYGNQFGGGSYWPSIDGVGVRRSMSWDQFAFPILAESSTTFGGNLSYSTTNTEVSGVDQGDLVKTDGRYIYVVSHSASGNSQLNIFDAVDPDSLPLLSQTAIDGTPLELFLMGDSVLLVSQSGSDVHVATVDLGDRSAPTIRQLSTVPGWFKESRVVDGIVQIFTSLSSVVPLETVCADGQSKVCFYETRSQLVERILGDPSLHQGPSVETFDPDSSQSLPSDSSTIDPYHEVLNTQSLLVTALFDSSGPVSQQVIGSAQAATIYVTQDGLFVFNAAHATALPIDAIDVFLVDPGAAQTNVNRFELSGDASKFTWSAEGVIEGQLLNSFSVGYHEDSLYVAVTKQDWTNSVVILEQDAESLVVVGETDPFAAGERIYSARFVEDQAFVVTFRQIDPLFVIDLSDSENPVVTGELEMPDYSQYLHPIGDDFLIGVGRDTDAWGWVQGMQVSLFDVRDRNSPVLQDKLLLGSLNSPLAEGMRGLSDHRAFSYFESHQILALPVFPTQSWYGSPPRSSVLLLRVDPDSGPDSGIEQIGEIEFAGSQVTRTIRIGDIIYSLSDAEIQAHDLNDPGESLVKQTLDGLPVPVQPTAPVEPPITPPPVVDPEPLETVVRIAPHLVDQDGNSVESVETGQTVWLEVTAADAQWLRQLGVFSSYFDVDFGDADVELAGESEFSDAFWVQRRDPADFGWRNIGATQGLTSESDPLRPWVLRVPIEFHSTGDITVQLTPSSQSGLETLLYGRDFAIPISAIEAESVTITVTPSQTDPMDVNRDGRISIVDPLNIINRLMEREASPDMTIDIDQHDVNKDGKMSANDIVILINYIENEHKQDQALAEILYDDDADEDEQAERILDDDQTLF